MLSDFLKKQLVRIYHLTLAPIMAFPLAVYYELDITNTGRVED